MSKETQEQLTYERHIEDLKDIFKEIQNEIWQLQKTADFIETDIAKAEKLLEMEWLEEDYTEEIKETIKALYSQIKEIKMFSDLADSRAKQLKNL